MVEAHDIEKSVLGACLVDIDAREYCGDELSEEAFANATHKRIFKSITKHGDLLAVEDELKDISRIGGYLADLMAEGSTNIEYHCQILIQKQIKRSVIEKCRSILKKSNDADANVLIDELSKAATEIDSNVKAKHSLTPTEIFERDKNAPKAEKINIGISDLDFGIYHDAMKKGQVELTIADSGHGKTQYALFKARHLLMRGYKIAWFQLEGYDSETARMFESLTNRDNIFICDSLYDIEDIKREARTLNREHNLDYIVFDYVQNIECNSKSSKTEKVEYISQQITRMAKDLNVYSHPLSQITISYDTRGGWKQEPSYGDVRWSQQLKQDASIITSVFRPSNIESLIINQDSVKDWNDNAVPYNSIFIRQAKLRHGKREWKRLHLFHHDDGLKMLSNETPF